MTKKSKHWYMCEHMFSCKKLVHVYINNFSSRNRKFHHFLCLSLCLTHTQENKAQGEETLYLLVRVLPQFECVLQGNMFVPMQQCWEAELNKISSSGPSLANG